MPITLDGTTGITTPTYNGTVTAEYSVPVTSFKNRIINGAMNVWQRGTTAITNPTNATSFLADRWSCYRQGFATGLTISQTTGVTLNGINRTPLRVQRTAGNTGVQPIFTLQQIESKNMQDLAGQTITFSFWARVGANFSGSSLELQINTGTGIDQSYRDTGFTGYVFAGNINVPSTQTTFAKFTFTVTLSSTASELAATFLYTPTGTAGTNDWFEIIDLQLEKGTSATSFDQRSYGTELSLCQRYYYRLQSPTTTAYSFGLAASTSTTNCTAVGNFPIPLRTRPTALEQSGTASNYMTEFAGTQRVSSAVPTFNTTTNENLWGVGFTVASGLTAGQVGFIYSNFVSGAYLGWSAEL